MSLSSILFLSEVYDSCEMCGGPSGGPSAGGEATEDPHEEEDEERSGEDDSIDRGDNEDEVTY